MAATAEFNKKVGDQELRAAGMRVTQPRLKILRILEKASGAGSHLSAEEVYLQLSKDGVDVGIATVYRVLTQFKAAGLVNSHNFEGGHAVYELDRGPHHDHMVCLESGEVVEFCDAQIEKLQRKIAERHGYELVDHSLVLYVRPRAK